MVGNGEPHEIQVVLGQSFLGEDAGAAGGSWRGEEQQEWKAFGERDCLPTHRSHSMNRGNGVGLLEESRAWQGAVPKQRIGESVDGGGMSAGRQVVGPATEDLQSLFHSFVELQKQHIQFLLRKEEPVWQRQNFPIYEDTMDPVRYLMNFESVCMEYNVQQADYMKILRTNARGRLGDLLAELPLGRRDYTYFKTLVHQRFAPSEEAARQAFRSAVLQPGENYIAFASRLEAKMEVWMEAAKIRTVEQLKDLLVKEQFFQSLPSQLVALVQARNARTLLETAQFADQLALYSKGEQDVGRKKEREPNLLIKEGLGRAVYKSRSSPGPFKDTKPRGNVTSRQGCYHCGETSHFVRQCPKLASRTVPGWPKTAKIEGCHWKVGSGNNGEDIPALALLRGEGKLLPEQQLQTDVSQESSWAEMPRHGLNMDLVEKVRNNCIKKAAAGAIGVPMAQRAWLETLRNDVVIINGNQVVAGFIDTGSDFSSVPRSALQEPVKWVGNVTLETYDSVVTHQPVVCMRVRFRAWEGELPILVHSNDDKFLIGADLLYRHVMEMEQLRQGQQKMVTRSKARETAQRKTTGEEDKEDSSPGAISTGEPASSRSSEEGRESTPMISQEEDREEQRLAEGMPVYDNSKNFSQAQRECPTLQECCKRAENVVSELKGVGACRFVWKQGLLYREFLPRNYSEEVQPVSQLVVPKGYRVEVLRVAHDTPFGGHLGIKKTLARISVGFYWPNIAKDVQEYCTTCDVCQRVGYPQDHPKAPLRPFPVVGQVFQRISIDILGPLPKTRRGRQYVLLIVDHASRYVTAFALSSITATQVALAFLEFASTFGWPEIVVSDRGVNFSANLMQKVFELAEVKHTPVLAYHQSANGLVERFVQTIGKMIKAYSLQHTDGWDVALPYLVSAIRDAPAASLGHYSPNEVVFGRKVVGPLQLLKSTWEGNQALVGNKGVEEYVSNLRKILERVQKVASGYLREAQKDQKNYYDRTAKRRILNVGDKVLLLKAERVGKTGVAWEGPYQVLQCQERDNYVIQRESSLEKPMIVHINRLKLYRQRQAQMFPVRQKSEEEFEIPGLGSKEQNTLEQVNLAPGLTETQRLELRGVLQQFQTCFSNIPGKTDILEHHIETGSHAPIRSSPYPLNGPMKEIVEAEIRQMLEWGVIKESTSEWGAPIVMVPKKRVVEDAPLEYRFCVDFRKLNQLTITDPYPTPRIETLIEDLAGARYISTLDLASGFWQVPLTQEASDRTAFVTPLGHYQFIKMPFGLNGASKTFQRLMDRVLRGLPFAMAYQDDIAVYSLSWEDHLGHIGEVMDRIQRAGLTVKAAKCSMGGNQVTYLGHIVGSNAIRPQEAKIEAIREWPVPQTKRDVQAFLGMVNFYRRYIVQFAETAAPLTDLCKKRAPMKVQWSPECQQAFESLKGKLVSAPILTPPRYDRPFVVRTDASEKGLGAVLLQRGEDGELHPVAYLSRKLLARERAYATIEKEGLALVWALHKLKPYLCGVKFFVETDHNPLSFIHQMKNSNARILRWALSLQDYDFEISHIKGRQNQIADALSRKGGMEDANVEVLA